MADEELVCRRPDADQPSEVAARNRQQAEQVAPDVAGCASADAVIGSHAALGTVAAEPTKRNIDREEFTGLAMASRTITADSWRDAVKGRRVWPFTRAHELTETRKTGDVVLIGVLYEKPRDNRFANGECYACWALTDLSAPRPRHVILQLRWQAFNHWRSGEPGRSAQRGSVFAVLNPVVVHTAGPKGMSEATLRVERSGQVIKLGMSASLGLCGWKDCFQPTNIDLGDRFCAMHSSQIYAQKRGRIIFGGMTLQGLAGVPGVGLNRPARRQLREPPPMPAAAKEDSEEARHASENVRARVALQLDDRRFWGSSTNKIYAKLARNPNAEIETERIHRHPVLGRGLDEENGLELDFATMDTEEKRKMFRMMEDRAARKEAKLARDGDAIAAAPALNLPGVDAPALKSRDSKPKRKHACESTEEEEGEKERPRKRCNAKLMAPQQNTAKPTRSLAELMRALTNPPIPLRKNPDCASQATHAVDLTSSASALIRTATRQVAAAATVAQGDPATSDSVARLRVALAEAADDPAKLHLALKDIERLPMTIWKETEGKNLYAAMGELSKCKALNIRQLLLSSRRNIRTAQELFSLSVTPTPVGVAAADDKASAIEGAA